jgi:hypothetical protein
MARKPKPSGRKLADKGRRLSRRVTNRRPPRQRFLIVCEGKRIEPNYFHCFRVPKDVAVEIIGEGYSTVRLVRRAMRRMQCTDYDQVWCVFDRDA